MGGDVLLDYFIRCLQPAEFQLDRVFNDVGEYLPQGFKNLEEGSLRLDLVLKLLSQAEAKVKEDLPGDVCMHGLAIDFFITLREESNLRTFWLVFKDGLGQTLVHGFCIYTEWAIEYFYRLDLVLVFLLISTKERLHYSIFINLVGFFRYIIFDGVVYSRRILLLFNIGFVCSLFFRFISRLCLLYFNLVRLFGVAWSHFRVSLFVDSIFSVHGRKLLSTLDSYVDCGVMRK
mmetsp:Transcript_15690/g.24085  ORF Transcript_15690/g.24085 Transcript_15690/m.24085 type:complete len:232 (-) Transcript_15690:268-963(-)